MVISVDPAMEHYGLDHVIVVNESGLSRITACSSDALR
jgi:hypothetical protein